MYEIKPQGDQFLVLKNGVIRGLFNSEKSAKENIKVLKELEKLKNEN